MCGFAASRQGATTPQTALCQEEQHRRGAAKPCNRTRSALIQKVNVLKPPIVNEYATHQTAASGQLPFLG